MRITYDESRKIRRTFSGNWVRSENREYLINDEGAEIHKATVQRPHGYEKQFWMKHPEKGWNEITDMFLPGYGKTKRKYSEIDNIIRQVAESRDLKKYLSIIDHADKYARAVLDNFGFSEEVESDYWDLKEATCKALGIKLESYYGGKKRER